MEIKNVNEWKREVIPVLKSKINEFELVGYARISIDELWDCLQQTVWKDNKEKRLHEVIQDIFHLPATVYIDYKTVIALKSDDSKEDMMESIRLLTEQS